jgi:diguanylate cyclase (GGDEF)-like protein
MAMYCGMNVELMHSLESQLDSYRASSAMSPDFLTTLIALASLLKTYDPLRAIARATEATEVAQEIGDFKQEAYAWAIRSYAEAQMEFDDVAHRHGKIALTLSEEYPDPITMGYAYFGIGQFLINQFRYDEALEVGLKGYDLLEQGGDKAAQANISFIIMGSYSRLGDRQQAESYAVRAVDMYRELRIPGGELVQLNNLAMHFFWMEEYETAWRFGSESLSILRKLTAGNIPFEFSYVKGAVLHTMAEIAIARGDLDSARGFLQEGLAFVHEPSAPISPNDETYLLLALGKLHSSTNDLKEARHSLLTAFWKASRLRHRSLMAEITQELITLYEKMGNHRRALWYFRFYHNIDKARYQDHLVAKMRQLEVEYEVKSTRREMAVLAEKNQQLEQAYEELQSANARIRELSIRDGLTKLYNRQYFEEWATAKFEYSQRMGQPFAVLLCDIDNFKRINDTWLHHIGDKVLQTVAAELGAICPSQGSAARYGGEEFVMAVPNYGFSQMCALAEQFRQRIEQYPWHTIHPDVRATVSVGVVDSFGISSLDQQLIQADLYLYLAKRQGKNKVMGEEMSTPLVESWEPQATRTA